MTSYNKTQDREMRTLTMQAMQIGLRAGLIDRVKDLGRTSLRLAERIKTHDYTQEDALLDLFIKKHKLCQQK